MSQNSISIPQLFDALPHQILIVADNKGTIVDCNLEAGNLVGLRSEQLKGQHFDSSFKSLGKNSSFSYDQLITASTDFLNLILTNSAGENLTTEIKVSQIQLNNNSSSYPDRFKIAAQIWS